MDERERGSIREALKQLPCELIITTLDTGDYILSSETVVERKRGDDLVASIFDHRFFLQLIKLKSIFPQPILMLEAPERMFERPFTNENAVYGALIYAAYKIGIPIIRPLMKLDLQR